MDNRTLTKSEFLDIGGIDNGEPIGTEFLIEQEPSVPSSFKSYVSSMKTQYIKLGEENYKPTKRIHTKFFPSSERSLVWEETVEENQMEIKISNRMARVALEINNLSPSFKEKAVVNLELVTYSEEEAVKIVTEFIRRHYAHISSVSESSIWKNT